MAQAKLTLLVGLGNPGKEYANTRHNAGFMALDAFVAAIDKEAKWQLKKDFQGEITNLETSGRHFLCVKPQTFMNKSGEAVSAISHFYRCEPKDIWVIHDDLDLPLGKAQLRRGGGLAGHHGLESIQEHIETAEFGRIRLGIRGHELRVMHDEKGVDTNQFVMGDFTSKELPILHTIIEEIIATGEKILKRGSFETTTITAPGYETFETTKDA